MHPWVASSVFIANWLKGNQLGSTPILDGLFDLGVILKGRAAWVGSWEQSNGKYTLQQPSQRPYIHFLISRERISEPINLF